MNVKTLFLLFSGLLLTVGSVVNAEEFLSQDEVKNLVMGKTIHATHLKRDFDFIVYFDKDGKTAFRKQDNETTKTTYSIKDNKHCIFWNGEDRCANILKNEDGSYTRVTPNGRKVVKWLKFNEGNKL